jgi:putative copper export protein
MARPPTSAAASVAVPSTGCKNMVNVVLRFIYLLAIALWIGGMAFFSFVAAPSIFKALPREQAGHVVADIFPKY